MSKPVLPYLETMITQACNLACLGCTNFSDVSHSGYVSVQQGRTDLEQWLSVLDIQHFGIIGGEPLINPEWRQWISMVRTLMPESRILFVTNGLLLHRHADIMEFFHDIGNIVLKISVHVANDELEHTILNLQRSHNWQPVHEYGLDRWLGANQVRLQIKRPDTFVKTYQGNYSNMLPWHSEPAEAFELCVQQQCPLLYQGRIYKCSTAALTPGMVARMAPHNLAAWQPYQSTGVAPHDSPEVIQHFVNDFGHANPMCAQCPSSKHLEGQVDHGQHVSFKAKSLSAV